LRGAILHEHAALARAIAAGQPEVAGRLMAEHLAASTTTTGATPPSVSPNWSSGADASSALDLHPDGLRVGELVDRLLAQRPPLPDCFMPPYGTDICTSP
jgi:hypothetical protein